MTTRRRTAAVLALAVVLVAAVLVGARIVRPSAPSPSDGEVTGIVYREHAGLLSTLLGGREGLVAEVGIDVLTDFATEGQRLELSREEISRRIDTSRFRTRTGPDGTFRLEPAQGPAVVCAQTASASGCVEVELAPPEQFDIVIEDGEVVVERP